MRPRQRHRDAADVQHARDFNARGDGCCTAAWPVSRPDHARSVPAASSPAIAPTRVCDDGGMEVGMPAGDGGGVVGSSCLLSPGAPLRVERVVVPEVAGGPE